LAVEQALKEAKAHDERDDKLADIDHKTRLENEKAVAEA
jgi:hypothetical protein